MAREYDFTVANGHDMFIGDHNVLEIAVTEDDAGTVALDVAGMELRFMVKTRDRDTEALIEKATGSPGGITVTGTFDADPATNTQRVRIELDPVDTYDPGASPDVDLMPNIYRYALKREDIGAETVLSYGDFELLRGAVR